MKKQHAGTLAMVDAIRIDNTLELFFGFRGMGGICMHLPFSSAFQRPPAIVALLQERVILCTNVLFLFLNLPFCPRHFERL